MPAPHPQPPLNADYFDGLSAQARPVRLSRQGAELVIDGDGLQRRVPWRRVSWPERSRHGQRQAYLPDHGLLVAGDAAAWDDWLAAHGGGPGWVNRWILSWRGVLAALVLALALAPLAWLWGLPALARGMLTFVPASVDLQLGQAALAQIEREMLRPTALPEAQQAQLRQRFAQAVQRADAQRQRRGQPPLPAYVLHFRATPEPGIGPNAFALPGGQIVITDALVRLLADRPEVIDGVLAHELGHIQHRHGMRLLVQGAVVSGVSALVLGDVSSLLAALPVLLGHAAYSRGFEFEADADAARLLRANGHSPEVMALLFERLRAGQASKGGQIELPIGLATHPPDAERVRRMLAVAD